MRSKEEEALERLKEVLAQSFENIRPRQVGQVDAQAANDSCYAPTSRITRRQFSLVVPIIPLELAAAHNLSTNVLKTVLVWLLAAWLSIILARQRKRRHSRSIYCQKRAKKAPEYSNRCQKFCKLVLRWKMTRGPPRKGFHSTGPPPPW
ncbi:hypothetical protein [Chromobacterium subtsugae]|uniref:hypothetical protein n=1 Tax=Chromobacterium subtsugae TaxID=251747 RepID=UPI00128DD2CE|nr:hypothetical protein [Chromobacterium subtsugae]